MQKLALAEQVEIRHFLEASSTVAAGPYDVSLVEGSITTQHDIERIRRIREDETPRNLSAWRAVASVHLTLHK